MTDMAHHVNVIDFDEYRYGKIPPARCRGCGNEWFVLRATFQERGVVTLSVNGNVTGYCGEPACAECGRLWP